VDRLLRDAGIEELKEEMLGEVEEVI